MPYPVACRIGAMITSSSPRRLTRSAAAAAFAAVALTAAGPAVAGAHRAPTRSITTADVGVAVTPADTALLKRLMNLGDPASDAVVDELFATGQVQRANTLLHDWKSNGQPIPAGLPPKLHAFLAAGLHLPHWADPAAVARGQLFERDHAFPEGLLAAINTTIGRLRMPMEIVPIRYVVDENQATTFAGKASQLLDGFYQADPLGPNGNLYVDLLKTRLMHSAVRHLLIAQTGWDDKTLGAPINQIAFLHTWCMFTNAAYDQLPKLGVSMTDAERADHLYLWRVYGALLGIPLDALPQSIKDSEHVQVAIDQQYAMNYTPRATAEAKLAIDSMAKQVTGPAAPLARPIINAAVRDVLGDDYADGLRLDRSPFWDPAVRLAMPVIFGGASAITTSGLPMGDINNVLFTFIRVQFEQGQDLDLPMSTSLLPPSVVAAQS